MFGLGSEGSRVASLCERHVFSLRLIEFISSGQTLNVSFIGLAPGFGRRSDGLHPSSIFSLSFLPAHQRVAMILT